MLINKNIFAGIVVIICIPQIITAAEHPIIFLHGQKGAKGTFPDWINKAKPY